MYMSKFFRAYEHNTVKTFGADVKLLTFLTLVLDWDQL
jgi:hypothetical protein